MNTDNREIDLQQLLLKVQSSAHWFYWIAGLSLVNMLVTVGGANFHFIIGSSFVDFCSGIGQGGMIWGYILGLLIISGFAFLGSLAAKGKKWPFILGMVVYAADGVLYLTVGDFLSTLFHAYVLFKFYQGFAAVEPYIQLKRVIEDEPFATQTIEIQPNKTEVAIESAAPTISETPLNPEV